MAEYNTKQRQLIWEYLLNQKDNHVTADDISHYLKEEGTSVGKSTIYRFLDLLERQNKIRKYAAMGQDYACYQLILQNDESHHHLLCVDCGGLTHLECDALNMLKNHMREKHNFVMDTTKTIFYGHCSKCEGDCYV